MPALPLLLFPDPRLREPATEIDTFGAELAELARDLSDTLVAVRAIGLTACHVGILRRVVVVRMAPDDLVRVLVNPAVTWASPETTSHEEGSVSMPGVREGVERPERVRIRYRDLAGDPHEAEASGFEAAVWLHEIDQLDGVFWIDRLSRLKRERLVKRFGKLRRG